MNIQCQTDVAINGYEKVDILRNQISVKAKSTIRSVVTSKELVAIKQALLSEDSWDETIDSLLEDISVFVARDPASHDIPNLILETYISFDAVLHYRLAQFILKGELLEPDTSLKVAHALSNRAKSITGIDINPFASIGKRFILDHGYGTVIGETSEIGDNCYILGGVVLGSLSIANNPNNKRHPTIGNNVEIGGSASILGNINIGDNVFIGPHCVITKSIPNDSKVSIINQLQVSKTNRLNKKKSPREIQIYGVVPMPNKCVIYGVGFRQPHIYIVDEHYRKLEQYKLVLNYGDASTLVIEFCNFTSADIAKHRKLHLYIVDDEETIVLLSTFLHKGYVSNKTMNAALV